MSIKRVHSKYIGSSENDLQVQYSILVDFDAVNGRLINGWKLLDVVCGFSAETGARQIVFSIGNEETEQLGAKMLIVAHTLDEVTETAVKKSQETTVAEFIGTLPSQEPNRDIEIPLLATVRYSTYPFSYSPCHICGHVPSAANNIPARQWVTEDRGRRMAVPNPMSNANNVPNAGGVRFWSPDDGWVIASLCYECYTEYAHIKPQPEDYAYDLRNDIGESFSDEV